MKFPFHRNMSVAFATIICATAVGSLVAQQKNQSSGTAGAHYTLEPSPKTIEWGYYDATVPPVLRIRSGDTVDIHTLITSSPQRLQDAGISPNEAEQSLRDIFQQVTVKGPRPH